MVEDGTKKTARSEGQVLAQQQQQQQQHNPNPTLCSLWMPQKRRFCRGNVHRGSRFCGAHLAADPDYTPTERERRVPCPLNPNHSVAAGGLERHLKVCTDRLLVPVDKPFYKRGVNGGRDGSGEEDSAFFHKAPPAMRHRQQPNEDVAATEDGEEGSAAEARATAELARMDRRRRGAAHHRDLKPAECAALIERVNQIYESVVQPHVVRMQTPPSHAHPRETPSTDGASAGLRGGGAYATRQQPQLHAIAAVLAAVGALPPAAGSGGAAPVLVRNDGTVALGESAGAKERLRSLLRDPPALVEFAAGKGALSLAVVDQWAAAADEARQQHHLGAAADEARQQHHLGAAACTAATTDPPPPILNPPLVVAVDRGGFRRRADAHVAKTGSSSPLSDGSGELYRPFLRLRVDLRDFDLRGVPELASSSSSPSIGRAFAGYGKHLCGSCTDYAITATLKAAAAAPQDSETSSASRGDEQLPPPLRLSGLVLATCCHHLAERANLSAMVYPATTPSSSTTDDDVEATGAVSEARAALGTLLDEFLAGETFDLVASLTSWGVSHGSPATAMEVSGPASEFSAFEERVPGAAAAAAAAAAGRGLNEQLQQEGDTEASVGTREAKAQVGLRAKRIIDWCRVLHLRSFGVRAEYLIDAYPQSASPENNLIVAW